MKFEYDSRKSLSNTEKHGIDFETAKKLWEDESMLTVPALTSDEERWIAIGRIRGKHWSAIYTHRGDALRIISVRRSRTEEIEYYESA